MSRTIDAWSPSVLKDRAESLAKLARTSLNQIGDSVVDGSLIAAEAVETAVDYWDTHEASAVTANARQALEERLPTAGPGLGLALSPVSAAARHVVGTAQGVRSLSEKAMSIATGEEPVPTPGEVIARTATGLFNFVGTSMDQVVHGAGKAAVAISEGDVEALAAATEETFSGAMNLTAVASSATSLGKGFSKTLTKSAASSASASQTYGAAATSIGLGRDVIETAAATQTPARRSTSSRTAFRPLPPPPRSKVR